MKHYAQVTEEDFDGVLQKSAEVCIARESADKSDQKNAQNPAQYTAATSGTELKDHIGSLTEEDMLRFINARLIHIMQKGATHCETHLIDHTGLELFFITPYMQVT